MLAQALLGAPKVLLLDEPTAGLDPEERVRLREYIRQLGRDKIVLITTHITGDVESIASEILLLHHGVLLADAPAEEFIRGGQPGGRLYPAAASPCVSAGVFSPAGVCCGCWC